MTRITPQYPDELMEDVARRLEFYTNVLPEWVDQIRVFYDYEDNEAILGVKQYFSRRLIKFYVGETFANRSDAERDESILHEIAHMFLSPVMEVIDTFKEVLIQDPDMEKLVEDQIERAEEYAVVDLIALLRAAGLEDEDDEEDA
jgi:hypothetical protein